LHAVLGVGRIGASARVLVPAGGQWLPLRRHGEGLLFQWISHLLLGSLSEDIGHVWRQVWTLTKAGCGKFGEGDICTGDIGSFKGNDEGKTMADGTKKLPCETPRAHTSEMQTCTNTLLHAVLASRHMTSGYLSVLLLVSSKHGWRPGAYLKCTIIRDK
jgi:hypothetical protein